MANVLVEETSLQGIANAIREKNGSDDTYKPSQMPQAISEIESTDANAIVQSVADGTISGEYTIQSASIREKAFNGCPNLQKIRLPELTQIPADAFMNCSGLKYVYAPKASATKSSAFNSCVALEKVHMPKVTDMEGASFKLCSGLRIGKFNMLNYCSSGAFISCTKLVALVICTTNCTISNTNVLFDTPIAKGAGYVYVPDNAVETYKTATNWNTYANQIKGLSEIPSEIRRELEELENDS